MKILRLRRLRKKGMSSSVSRKTEEQRRVRNLLNTSIVLKISIAIATFILAVMSITMLGNYQNLGVTVGFKADMDHYNSFKFEYEDPQKTQQKRLDAVGKIPDIYRFEEVELVRDLSVITSNIKEWLIKRKELESAEEPPTAEMLLKLRNEYEKKIKNDLPRLKEDEISVIMSLEKPIEGMIKIKGIIEGFLEEKIILKNAEIPPNSLNITLKKFAQIENDITKAVNDAFKETEKQEKQKLLNIPFFFR